MDAKVALPLPDAFTDCDWFLGFVYAIRDAKRGDLELASLFIFLGLNIADHPMAIFQALLDKSPLALQQSEALRKIVKLGLA